MSQAKNFVWAARASVVSIFLVTVVASATAWAEGYDPYAVVRTGLIEVDMAEVLANRSIYVPPPQEQPDFSKFGPAPTDAASLPPGQLPPGWVQLGEVVQREEIALGLQEVDPVPSKAWEDIEGNQYPRKHTLFLNFNGAVLYGGNDNSAENRSTLARAGHQYPGWAKSEASALAVIQRVKEDVSSLGVRVVYEKRPSKTIPYTMAMVSGSWQDTNISEPAGGVAPGTDCEARGQRHVVYVFDSSAATVGQEAAHAWGLDHTMGGDRIMSYQWGTNKHFGDNCQQLCEAACQGPGTIGCRMVHEKYCGEDSERQNDLAELGFIFGTNEPDTTPPTVKITDPIDGADYPVGTSFKILGEVHDDYGGVGWKLTVKKDGEVAYDQVDYDRLMGWNFSNLPEGVYEITLEAEDHADHVVRDTVTITVGTAQSGSDSNGESDSGEPDSDSDNDSDDADSDVPTTSDTAASGGDEDSGDEEGSGEGTDTAAAEDGGCAISQKDRGGPLALLTPLLGLGLAWRARRRRNAAK